jgi:DNA repair protein RecO (recombination protein O)
MEIARFSLADTDAVVALLLPAGPLRNQIGARCVTQVMRRAPILAALTPFRLDSGPKLGRVPRASSGIWLGSGPARAIGAGPPGTPHPRDNGRVPLYRDHAIVLRTHKLGEADRIVTLLTRHHGKVRAVAKGVRRTSSRIGARMEPFMLADVQFYEGRNLDIVSQVETREPYARRISQDYGLYTAATAMVETADKLVDHEKEPANAQYRLLHGALGALSRREHDPGMLLDSFLLRSLSIAGYAPSFDECATCGTPGPHRAFAVAGGGAACESCRPSGAAAPAHETFTLLGALLAGDWVTADASVDKHRRDAAGIIAAYTQFHLEKKVRSLGLVDRSGPHVNPGREAASA